jgi:hypothetical protein
VPNVTVELNFYYLHFHDARTFAKWAKERTDEEVTPSIYARHAILSVVFASEALINRVLVEFGAGKDVAANLEKNSILEKWLLAPVVCNGGASASPFDRTAEPIQSFRELIQIRNWLAHPKVDNYLPANLDLNSSIAGENPGEEYPWLEMLKGDAWAQTHMPKNPFELTHEHADQALAVLERMISELNQRLGGRLSDSWLERITVKDDGGVHNYRASVYSIWGGYGGAS